MKPHHWQDISTAPKDGTAIMVWRRGWDVGVVAWWGNHPAPEVNVKGWLSAEYMPGALEEGFMGWPQDADSMPTLWTPIPNFIGTDKEAS